MKLALKRSVEALWFDERGDVWPEEVSTDDGDIRENTIPEGEAIFLVARDQNKSYLAQLDGIRKQFKKRMAKQNMKSEESLMAVAKAMSRAILLDWKGHVVNADGEFIEPTELNRYKTLAANPEFREFIGACSEDFDQFMEQEREDKAGKLLAG